MSFNAQNLNQREFNEIINNFTIRCHLEKFSIVFLAEENKDVIKEIYSSRYYNNTMPPEFNDLFNSVEDFFDYISDNPALALSLKDLLVKGVIYIRANVDNKIIQLPLPMDILPLTPEQLVKRQNLRLKNNLSKIQIEYKDALKIINELKVNQSFNNGDFEKLRLQNKKLVTSNRKINSEKNTLIEENITLKTRLDKIRNEVKQNMSNLESFHNQSEIISNNNENFAIINQNSQTSHKITSQKLKKSDNTSIASSNNPNIVISGPVIELQGLDHQKSERPDNSVEKIFVDLDNDEASLSQHHQSEKQGHLDEQQSVLGSNVSQHHSHAASQDHLSVVSRPQSLKSSVFYSNLHRIGELSEFTSNCGSISYSKKEQKQHKKIAKFQKQFVYFEDNISHICKTKEENQILFKFFIRKLKMLKLLYRASQNEFDIGKFHKKCDRIKHTILLVQTEFGKKIGAYSPIAYEGFKKPRMLQDPQCQTFLFSISNNEKYRVLNGKKANFNSLKMGPSFGRLNLHLEHRGNLQRQNKCLYPFDFQNSWSTQNQASIKFIGEDSIKFKTLQWEVYSIQFFE